MTITTRLMRTVGMLGAAALAVPMLLNVTTASAAYTTTGTTPFTAARFVLMSGGQTVGTFQEQAGINSQVDLQEPISSSPQGQTVHIKQFDKTKPPEVTLKRGLDDGRALLEWRQMVHNRTPSARQTVTLEFETSSGSVLHSYTLLHAWPTKIEISGMRARNSEVLVDRVTLVAEQITQNT